MDIKAIAARYKNYKNLFTKPESDAILEHLLDSLRALYYLQPSSNEMLTCTGERYMKSICTIPGIIRFQLDKPALLDGISISNTYIGEEVVAFSAKIAVKVKSHVIVEQTADFTVANMNFEFPQKVLIAAGKVYEILVIRKLGSCAASGCTFKRQKLGDIEFIPMQRNTDEIVEEAHWSGTEIRFIDINKGEVLH